MRTRSLATYPAIPAAEPTPATEPTWDLLIVGSGPVGLTIANELAGSSIRVLIVESGDVRPESAADDLDRFENVGEPRVMDGAALRTRVFGGTSSIWSGRCTPFDDIDFEQRPWIPFSGWPIAPLQLTPFLQRASDRLGLGRHPYDDGLWSQLRKQPRSQFDTAWLRSHFWQYSHDRECPRDFTHFGAQFRRRPPPNVEVVLQSTVTRMDFGPSGRVFNGVEVAAPDNTRRTIRARRAVLCAGGIENARLLLASLKGPQRTLAADIDATGRFLMDHPRSTIGTFSGRDARRIGDVLGLYRFKTEGRRRYFTHGIALSSEAQRREQLLNCAAWLTEVRAPDDPWDAMRRLWLERTRSRRDIGAVVTNLPLVGRGAWRYLARERGVSHKCDVVNLDCLVEQVPDPNSRVMLSDKTDRFGVPLARIDWKIAPLEKTTISRFASIIEEELKRQHLPLPNLAAWVRDHDRQHAELIDVAHPMGTTRMSDDPGLGVVDTNCRVHGIDGLYAAGSSVFPTGGHANPTFMALALAIRLADHLKGADRA